MKQSNCTLSRAVTVHTVLHYKIQDTVRQNTSLSSLAPLNMARVLEFIQNLTGSPLAGKKSPNANATKRSPTRRSFRRKSSKKSEKVSCSEEYVLENFCDNEESLEIVTSRLSDLQFKYQWNISNFEEKVKDRGVIEFWILRKANTATKLLFMASGTEPFASFLQNII